jgi:hypothetical protein
MARGWESKSVEQQQDEAKSERTRVKVQLSAEQIAERQRRDGLELARKRVARQLEVASNPRHRQMLEAALAELDAQLSEPR